MSRTLWALAVAGVVSLVAWAVTALVTSRVTGLEGRDRWDALVIGVPLGLVVILIAPLIAGAIAGFLSRTPAAVLGSVGGYLGVAFVTSRIDGEPILSVNADLLPAVVLGVLVVAGHMTGVAARPRLRPA